MNTNHLSGEKSPYLLQHVHNPVDWHPWGVEAFDKARRENKPIFLSIGYSTCHWCHVMERESFEDDRIAELLNRSFVPIKVDREERPDVDRVYMTFVQATTGGGGWPMSVFLTPDLEPFFGGTYFPPESRYGHPGFSSVLEQIASAWMSDRRQIVDSAQDIIRQLRQSVEIAGGSMAGLDAKVLESGYYYFRRTFDTRNGGFGDAPKFPRPVVLNFLLRYWARHKSSEALDMTLATLRAMADGGMHDQLGGGFHRYSVDARWFVPHFEKMLYDQAQMVVSYLEAYQITGDAAFSGIARRTLDYVLRDMTSPDGAFYSAEDADSVVDPAEPQRKGEGAYYVWTWDEIESVVGQPAAAWLCRRYGVEPDGNVADDPHGEFHGKSILYAARTLEETAAGFDRPEEEVRAAILDAERRLLKERNKRVRPHLDDKILTSWNGLMVSAFAKAGAVLEEPAYTAAARRAAEFLLARVFQPDDGTLLRRFREGEAAIPGFLDDYAFFTQGLLDLYETDFDTRHLELAVRLTAKQRELFEDVEQGAFFSNPPGDQTVLLRIKEDHDGAEPSGNSIAVLNLLRLAEITGRKDFRASAERALGAFASRISAVGAAVPQMLVACEYALGKPKQIVLAGEPGSSAMKDLLRVLHSRFVPDRVILMAGGESGRKLGGWLPWIRNMSPQDGQATAFVCENYACHLPTADPEKFGELLQ